MNGCQKDYAKKPDTKDYILYEFHLHGFLKKTKVQGQTSDQRLPGAGNWERWVRGVTRKGHGGSFWVDGKH